MRVHASACKPGLQRPSGTDLVQLIMYSSFFIEDQRACVCLHKRACAPQRACWHMMLDGRIRTHIFTALPGDVAGVSKAGHKSRGARFETWSLFSGEKEG